MEQAMRVSFAVYFGMIMAITATCTAESNGKQNRRNRGGATLQIVEKQKKVKHVQKKAPKPIQVSSAPVSMPEAFESFNSHTKDIFPEPVSYQQEPKPVEEKVAIQDKRPKVIKNDPEKLGVDSNAFYEKLSGESRKVFQEMDQKGKILALRLSIPYQDPNKAVEDASFEMQRRQQSVNLRQKRTQRKRSAYY